MCISVSLNKYYKRCFDPGVDKIMSKLILQDLIILIMYSYSSCREVKSISVSFLTIKGVNGDRGNNYKSRNVIVLELFYFYSLTK